MSEAPLPTLPPPFDETGDRAFSFYPPILGIEHNEWRAQQATWSEILVVNTKNEVSLWVPRRYIGDLSRVDEPVMIVGLKKELEHKAGGVWPHEKRVLSMPPVSTAPVVAGPEPVPAPMNLRMDSGAESRIGRMILVSLVVAVGVLALVVAFYRGRTSGEQVEFHGVMQSNLGLSGQDDYFAVVRKLGQPEQDRWRSDQGELQFRGLKYPTVTVILMGSDRKNARYIGSVNREGLVVDSVDMPGGVNAAAMIRRLPKF
ncbi:MAG: hypothetical protein K2X03_03260 [Bryobacteraceae bacterium]|nr:hypothetical protein [Bryobacteraceae bacterium]